MENFTLYNIIIAHDGECIGFENNYGKENLLTDGNINLFPIYVKYLHCIIRQLVSLKQNAMTQVSIDDFIIKVVKTRHMKSIAYIFLKLCVHLISDGSLDLAVGI